jgi:predicted amidohydrolase
MRLAALQMPLRHGDKSHALSVVDALLAESPGLDLALLPETAITGYMSSAGDFDLAPFAETLGGPSTEALADLARRHHVALAGPLVERDGDALYNAMLLFDESGALVGHYRKRHPWYPESWATPGDRGTPVTALLGAAIVGCICFDIHFIADDAPESLTSADLCLFASAWVDDRRGTPERIVRGLARRFGTAFVHSNWGGGDPRVLGQGGSCIVNANGEVLARARGLDAEAVIAEWSPG